MIVLVHDHIVPVAYVSALQRPMASQSAMSAHLCLAFTYHSRLNDSVQVNGLSACLVRANLHMDALLCVLQTKQTLKVRLNLGVSLPENLHEVEVRSFVASFFLAEGEQLINIPVSVVERHMIDPTILAKPMPTCVVVKLSFSQTNSALPKQRSNMIILLVLDDIPSGLFLIEHIVEIVGIEVGEGVEHESPSIGHGAEHRLHSDLLPNLLEQLIEVIDRVWPILGQSTFQYEIIDLILIVILVFVILFLIIFIIVAFLHFALL